MLQCLLLAFILDIHNRVSSKDIQAGIFILPADLHTPETKCGQFASTPLLWAAWPSPASPMVHVPRGQHQQTLNQCVVSSSPHSSSCTTIRDCTNHATAGVGHAVARGIIFGVRQNIRSSQISRGNFSSAMECLHTEKNINS
jgi:hypothetical protein